MPPVRMTVLSGGRLEQQLREFQRQAPPLPSRARDIEQVELALADAIDALGRAARSIRAIREQGGR